MKKILLSLLMALMLLNGGHLTEAHPVTADKLDQTDHHGGVGG
ncbi:hypothetical protein [Paenibacillus tyrfis]|nr:hypothetical protein [Paenibacillus tyrfis]